MNYQMKFPGLNIKPTAFLWILLLLCTLGGYSQSIPNAPQGKLILDNAKLLSSDEFSSLEQELEAYNDSTSTQIAILTIESLEGGEIADFASRVYEKWHPGQKGKDNGILIVVAKSDRKIRIETGYGIEATLTDALSRRIIENDIKPNFKNSQFYQGLHNGISSIRNVLSGTYKAEAEATHKHRKGRSFPWITALIIGIVFLTIVKKGGGKGGGGQTYGSGGRYNYRPPTFWGGGFGGGSFGGGGSSGGGFGGFGGGSSGGGGASGSW